ncbi:UDP-N-acetylmuramate--L-alanine ligase [Candidatus Dependentiae bacterium]|nr:UDP-N-acetylmuramate--L-alanine ligase [Candidatus Dependentiae bacterium]
MYRKNLHIHFVGIGGIGMSGIAKILKYQGYTISGCDQDLNQQSVHDLQAIGCKIYQGNNTPYCNDASVDVLVYSSAIRTQNPEILAAQERGIPTIPRALMLAELMRTKFSIAIAGAHGKTTTTSLISHILIEAQMDPTVVIGGHLKNISANARFGSGDFLVAEADESDRTLIYLQATLAVVTNIDLEHLDTYTDIDDIKNTFKQFLNNLPFYGCAVLCIDDPHVRSLLPLSHIKTIKYGLDPASADLYANDIILNADSSIFTVYQKNQHEALGTIRFSMLGKHNVLNALAATALSLHLQVPFAVISHALSTFKGIDRRFSFKGTYRGAEIFDDYGHHPEEIRNTLLVARRRSQGKVIVAFQPHRYTRTDKLWDHFVQMFLDSGIDKLIITDIYPASEDPIPEITGKNLAKAIELRNPSFEVVYAPLEADFQSIIGSVEQTVSDGDLLLLQGAGKINKLADYLV